MFWYSFNVLPGYEYGTIQQSKREALAFPFIFRCDQRTLKRWRFQLFWKQLGGVTIRTKFLARPSSSHRKEQCAGAVQFRVNKSEQCSNDPDAESEATRQRNGAGLSVALSDWLETHARSRQRRCSENLKSDSMTRLKPADRTILNAARFDNTSERTVVSP